MAHPSRDPGTAQLFRGKADEHIDLVAAGHRDHQILFPGPHLLQELQLGAVAGDGQHIQAVHRPLEGLFLHIHHGDVVLPAG